MVQKIVALIQWKVTALEGFVMSDLVLKGLCATYSN